MILTLDLGNTCAKLVLFDGDTVKEHWTCAHADCITAIAKMLQHHPAITRLCWCSVAAPLPLLERYLAQLPLTVKQLSPLRPPQGITIGYTTPETLGADRLAAVLGARALRSDRTLLVIDAGTCITFDVLTHEGCYLGGNISPGVAMRLRALHEFTARLPLAEAEGETPLLGTSTDTALRSGVVRGISFEIEGYIRRLQAQYGSICAFLTGGNRFNFHISSESCIFADDFLVARGLAQL